MMLEEARARRRAIRLPQLGLATGGVGDVGTGRRWSSRMTLPAHVRARPQMPLDQPLESPLAAPSDRHSSTRCGLGGRAQRTPRRKKTSVRPTARGGRLKLEEPRAGRA